VLDIKIRSCVFIDGVTLNFRSGGDAVEVDSRYRTRMRSIAITNRARTKSLTGEKRLKRVRKMVMAMEYAKNHIKNQSETSTWGW
jgi:hypothetical protein